jgi:hypothetical protein
MTIPSYNTSKTTTLYHQHHSNQTSQSKTSTQGKMSGDRDRSSSKDHHLLKDAELLAGSASAVYGANQLLKATEPDEDKTNHLVKAGIAALVAIGAFEMLRRSELSQNDPDYRPRSRSRSRSFSPDDRSRDRSSSHHSGRSGRSHEVRHHKAHIAEEVIGAYALGKELLGDKKHRVGHLVAEAIGAAGLYQELRGRDRLEEEERRARSRNRR